MSGMTGSALRTFGRGGIHPQPHKEATEGRPIEPLPVPREVRLPLAQHIGEPAVPLVKKGDAVQRGQKIAEGEGAGVPLHATITGSVKRIDDEKVKLQARLDAIQTRYLRQFSALDGMLASMQQTSSFLTQQITNLPTPGKST